MEARLWNRKDFWNFLSISLAICVPIALPALNMNTLIIDTQWAPLTQPVNRWRCNCSCFDTIFRGAFEHGGSFGYKHAYFNSTTNTFKIWTLTVIFVLFVYSTFQRLLSLLFTKQLRWSMGVMFLSALYSLFHVWWSTWNYWNDNYLSIWDRQWFFTVTESLSIILIVAFLDKGTELQPLALLTIAFIAGFQGVIIVSDLFYEYKPFEIGFSEKVIRNAMFLISDVVIGGLSLCQLRIYAVENMGAGLIIFICQRYILIFIVTLFITLFTLNGTLLQTLS